MHDAEVYAVVGEKAIFKNEEDAILCRVAFA